MSYIPTIAGNLLAGAGIVINLETLWRYGLPSIKNAIFSDKDRQILLTLFCFVGQVASIPISVYQSIGSRQPLTVSATVMFMCILYGLTLLVHNSMVRLYVAVAKKINLNLFNKICCILYILPIVAYTPYWILIARYYYSSISPRTDPLFAQVWEPILFSVVVGTEALALLSDVILVRRVLSSKQRLSGQSTVKDQTTTKAQVTESSGDTKAIWRKIPFLRNVSSTTFTFMTVYIIIWCTLTLDIILKSLVVTTDLPVVFDGAVTLVGMSLRSTANLSFGTTVKNAASGQTAIGKGSARTGSSISNQGTGAVIESRAMGSNPGAQV